MIKGTSTSTMVSPEDSIAPYVLRPEQRRILHTGTFAAVAVALIVSTWLLAAGEKGRPAPPQHDTLMYMQYARAIAVGRPYEFQRGAPPSTGSTSHLYPALLGVFYALGFRNENLCYASLALNAAFYVAIVALTGCLAAALLPHLMWLAMTLALFNGPVLLGAFGQTDMGLFALCVLGVWTALLYGRPVSAWAAMTAAAWTRPEGLLVALALTVSGAVFLRTSRRAAFWFGLGLWGLAQFALVLLWNRWLTGSLTFHSILGKGHWVWHPGWGALKRTVRDAAHLISGIWFCAPVRRYAFRTLYGWPILSGLLATAGWIRWLRDEQVARRIVAWSLLVMLSGAFTVAASSGWQGFFYDRHLSWTFPFSALLVAGGANWMYEQRLRSPRTSRAPLLTLLLAGYALVMFPVFVTALRSAAHTTGLQLAFVRNTVPAQVPRGSRIGILNYPGLAYVLPDYELVHLGGYISRRFVSQGDFIASLDILKNEPEQRFDFWILSGLERRHPTLQSVLGPMLAGETDVFPSDMRLALLQADFETLDGLAGSPNVDAAFLPANWRQSDRLDVGYDKDEDTHHYSVRDRDPKRHLEPGLATRARGQRRISDVGRVVLGEERFTLRACAGAPARLVWRTADSLTVNAWYDDQVLPFRTIALGTNTSCRIFINGRNVAEVGGTVFATQDFHEIVFDIGADVISSDTLAVRVEGDHISFGWWLFQPCAE